ncbi:MAG: NUDIX hydrolase [Gammaproteobacteria bacterium]|nr:NUDIX hydrolase [Gammaproteobacteria bacterium]
MNYCSECGKPVVFRIPEGDNLPRYVCEHCDTIHYQNPKIVTGCLPVWEDKILLCKRAIEPRYGLWTLPAGFMENAETMEQAAMRECMEEANANVELEGLYTLFSLPHVNQVYVMYRARLLDLDYFAGSESLDVALYKEEEIPWQQLAFRTITHTLEFFFADRKAGHFNIHTRDIHPDQQPQQSSTN